ncbi:MAG: glycoside hydrolase family 2, partial [Planctomycetota bacterium]
MKTTISLTSFLLLAVFASTCCAQEIVDEWRYTLRRPDASWRQADYDDADWTKGFGGFGTRDTPNARVGTTWSTNSIWLRKSFDLKALPAKPALLMHHDEDAEVYINGKQVAAIKGYKSKYFVLPIENGAALRVGENTMA